MRITIVAEIDKKVLQFNGVTKTEAENGRVLLEKDGKRIAEFCDENIVAWWDPLELARF